MLTAAARLDLQIPIVVRLQGTRSKEARALIKQSGLAISTGRPGSRKGRPGRQDRRGAFYFVCVCVCVCYVYVYRSLPYSLD